MHRHPGRALQDRRQHALVVGCEMHDDDEASPVSAGVASKKACGQRFRPPIRPGRPSAAWRSCASARRRRSARRAPPRRGRARARSVPRRRRHRWQPARHRGGVLRKVHGGPIGMATRRHQETPDGPDSALRPEQPCREKSPVNIVSRAAPAALRWLRDEHRRKGLRGRDGRRLPAAAAAHAAPAAPACPRRRFDPARQRALAAAPRSLHRLARRGAACPARDPEAIRRARRSASERDGNVHRPKVFKGKGKGKRRDLH